MHWMPHAKRRTVMKHCHRSGRLTAFLLVVFLSLAGPIAHARDMVRELIEACRQNNVAEVTRLLDAGTDINARDNTSSALVFDMSGATPLSAAASQGHLGLVKLLISRGAKINPGGYTPLMAASTEGNIEMIQLLLKNGADINATDKPFKRTALWGACRTGQAAVAKILLEHGANVNSKESNGRTILMTATSSYKINLELVRLLLQHGAKVNAQDNSGETALTDRVSN